MMRANVRGRVLVLDDEKNIVIVLRTILEKRGFQVEGFTSSLDALQIVQNKDFDAVVTDLFMPELDGMGFLNKVHEMKPKMPVIMITAFGTVDTAVDAIKAGAFDYVTKPFEQSEICAVVEKAVNTNRLSRLELIRNEAEEKSVLSVPKEIVEELEFSEIFSGNSKSIKELRSGAMDAIKNPVSTLIIGETGTGREQLVDDIHRHSNRNRMSCIRMNCAAIPSTRHNLELFGDERKVGRLEQADNGILFIDEIQELNLETQIRLFDFMNSHSAERIDGSSEFSSDARIIAGASASLQSMIEAQKFREELYFKLNIVELRIPPLRDRSEDLPKIISYLVATINSRLGGKAVDFDSSALDWLQAQEWRGNFPQLESVIERAIVKAERNSTVSKDSLPLALESEDSSRPLASIEPLTFRDLVKEKTREFEREIIKDALHNFEENVTKTARFLGISRKGLQNKIKELRIR